MLTLNDFPESLRPHAQRREPRALRRQETLSHRDHVLGASYQGWVVEAQAAANDLHALQWLVQHGFIYHQSLWARADDEAADAPSAALPVPAPRPVPTVLTRAHYSRLRFYWAHEQGHIPPQGDTLDLDLTAAALLVRAPQRSGHTVMWVTPAGVQALADEKAREIERRRPHHALAGRLAQWLRGQGRMTWENIELLVDLDEGRQAIRPDVFSMVATYNAARLNPCVHEVKVSRSDFLADLAKPEKRSGYARLAEQVFYVAPDGMITVDDLPEGFGLITESLDTLGSFTVVKKPKKRRVTLTPHHFMNLILKPGERPEP